jgi:hypothetical protein
MKISFSTTLAPFLTNYSNEIFKSLLQSKFETRFYSLALPLFITQYTGTPVAINESPQMAFKVG